jgi:hypothetical protein
MLTQSLKRTRLHAAGRRRQPGSVRTACFLNVCLRSQSRADRISFRASCLPRRRWPLGSIMIVALCSCSSERVSTTTSFIAHNEIDNKTTVWSSTDGKRTSSYQYRIKDEIHAALPQNTRNAHPIDGVFVGVSNYGDRPWPIPTPAHAVGAAIMYSVFLSAAARSESGSMDYSISGGVADIRDTHLELAADLRLDPIDPTWSARDIATLLGELRGIRINGYVRSATLPKDGLWPYLQTTTSLTKNEILGLADAQATRVAAAGRGRKDAPLAIFYLATHGAIDSEGHRYAMAADSVADDFSTWISYGELLERFAVRKGGARQTPTIVIFDTCLTGNSDTGSHSELVLPPGITMLASASPGEYSWHWKQATDYEILWSEKAKGWSVFNSTERTGPRRIRYYVTMSVVPFAAAAVLRELEDRCGQPSPQDDTRLTAGGFLTRIEQLVPGLARKEAQDRPVQHVEVRSGATPAHLETDFFRVRCGELTFPPPADE